MNNVVSGQASGQAYGQASGQAMNKTTNRDVFHRAFPNYRINKRDPQWELYGSFYAGVDSDQIVFEVPLMRFTISCTVNIPMHGTKSAPVVIQYLPFPPRARMPNETLQQDVVRGRFWKGPNSDCVIFHFDIMLFRFFFIVSIPEEGNDQSKIFLAHKLLPEPPRE